MSEVEIYWKQICDKVGVNKPWSTLHPQEQMMIVQSINLLLQVLHRKNDT